MLLIWNPGCGEVLQNVEREDIVFLAVFIPYFGPVLKTLYE